MLMMKCGVWWHPPPLCREGSLGSLGRPPPVIFLADVIKLEQHNEPNKTIKYYEVLSITENSDLN
jgi:hypothetical protein